MTVEDKDRGLKTVYKQAARFAGEYKVGIFDPVAAKYAGPLEAKFHFIRRAFDGHKDGFNKKLRGLHAVMTEKTTDPAASQLEAAESLAEAIRRSIQSQPLILTGLMLASVEVRQGKKSK